MAASVLPAEPDRIALANLAAEAPPAPNPGRAPQAEANDAQPAVLKLSKPRYFLLCTLFQLVFTCVFVFVAYFVFLALFSPGFFSVVAASLFQFSFSRFVVFSYY